jgi:hypothetical protein
MKRIILGLAAVVAVGVSSTPAQVPQFPQTLPAGTVVGRTGIGPGPSQAIPFANLRSLIFGGGGSLTPHAVLLGNGTSPFGTAPIGTAGRVLVDQGAGADPGFKAVSGDATMGATGALTVANNAVTNAKAAQMAAYTIKGNNTAATANAADLSPGQALAALALSRINVAGRFGALDVWQRGAGGSAAISVAASTTAYTADGCYLKTGTNQAHTVSAVAGIATGSLKAAAVQRTAAQTGVGSVIFGCPLDTDEIAMFAGSFVTLSFTASAGANWSPASGNLTYELFCGTGSVVKQSVGYTGQTTPINTTVGISPGGAAARYQSTSAAIVAANSTQCEIQFNWTPVGTAGAADTINIDDIQLEIATSATDVASNFQRALFGDLLRRAQRHFAKSFPYGTAPAQNAGLAGAFGMIEGTTNSALGIFWFFPTPMRIAPTVTAYNPSNTNSSCRNVTAPADGTSSVDPDTAISANGVAITCATNLANVNAHVYIQASADAGI